MSTLEGPGFAADDGSVPDALADVLARHARARAGMREVVTCLAGHRLLVPLLEVAADQLEGDHADPCAGQDRAMAAVSIRLADGSAAGLAFTGTAPLGRWNAGARPLPVTSSRAAAAVLAAGGSTLLVDPGSPNACRIGGLALVRLAEGGSWPPPWDDPQVRRAVLAELAPAMADGGLRVRLSPPAAHAHAQGAGQPDGLADQPDLVVHLRFPPDVPEALGRERAALVARRLAGSSLVRAVLDGALGVTVD